MAEQPNPTTEQTAQQSACDMLAVAIVKGRREGTPVSEEVIAKELAASGVTRAELDAAIAAAERAGVE